MSTETADPPIPRVKIGNVRRRAYRSGVAFFDLSVEPNRYLSIDDAPAALASLNDAMAPLARFGESLSTAMNLARREGHDFLSLGLDEPDLGAAIMRLIEVHHMLVPPRPDADKLPMQWRVTLPGPEEPASPTDAGGRGPRPSRDIGGDDPGGDQATVNIPCPHCKRLIQARLLKAPGSE